MRLARLVGLVGVFSVAAASPGWTIELWSSGDRSVSWSGSIRELVVTTNGTDAERFQREAAAAGPVCLLAATFAECPAFDGVGDWDVFESLTRVRQRLDLELGAGLSGVVVYDHELRIGQLDRFPRRGGSRDDTFLGVEDEIRLFEFDDATHREWRHLLYRAYLRYESEHVQLTVGRQRIPWGVGRLWNPIDRFNPIGPLAIEGDQSGGIDAVDLRWLFSGFDQLQLVYAPGTRHEEARYAARFQGVLSDIDVGVMAGVFAQARTAGFDLAGNLGDSAWRVEAVFTDPQRRVWELDEPGPDEPDSFWQIVVSFDHNFDVGNGLYVLVEHLYDGNALGFGEGKAGSLLPFFGATDRGPALAGAGPFVSPVDPARFGGSGVVSLASHLTGFQLGTDLTSAVSGNLLTLVDWKGDSAAIFPSLTITGLNAVEITVGAQLFLGGRRSQFGDQQPLVYLLVEYFF